MSHLGSSKNKIWEKKISKAYVKLVIYSGKIGLAIFQKTL